MSIMYDLALLIQGRYSPSQNNCSVQKDYCYITYNNVSMQKSCIESIYYAYL